MPTELKQIKRENALIRKVWAFQEEGFARNKTRLGPAATGYARKTIPVQTEYQVEALPSWNGVCCCSKLLDLKMWLATCRSTCA